MKRGVRVRGNPCWREDGRRLAIPPGPVEIHEHENGSDAVRIVWREHGRERSEVLMDRDYLACLSRRAIELLP